jgi:hypothetical protein
MTRQYWPKPTRCHRTTVSGLTAMRVCLQPDQNLGTRTQKNLSNNARCGLGRLRFKTASCCRRTRSSSKRLRHARKRRRLDAKMTRMRRNIGGPYRESLVQARAPMSLISKADGVLANDNAEFTIPHESDTQRANQLITTNVRLN